MNWNDKTRTRFSGPLGPLAFWEITLKNRTLTSKFDSDLPPHDCSSFGFHNEPIHASIFSSFSHRYQHAVMDTTELWRSVFVDSFAVLHPVISGTSYIVRRHSQQSKVVRKSSDVLGIPENPRNRFVPYKLKKFKWQMQWIGRCSAILYSSIKKFANLPKAKAQNNSRSPYIMATGRLRFDKILYTIKIKKWLNLHPFIP